MKLTFKILALGVLAALFMVPVQAQQYSYTLNTNILAVGVSATNTFTLTRSDIVAFQFKVMSAPGCTNTFSISQSVDGTAYSDAAATITVADASGGTFRINTNITVGAIGYLRIITANASTASTSTNIIMSATKPDRYGQ